jgi:cell division septation protein DedD
VERVFAERGISRGGAQSSSTSVAVPATPQAPAAHLAPNPAAIPAPAPAPPAPASKAAAVTAPEPAVQVAEFVSENDVRAALSRHEKIFIGPKTIVTPSARDFGEEHGIFVVTNLVPAASKKSRRET